MAIGDMATGCNALVLFKHKRERAYANYMPVKSVTKHMLDD